MDQKIFSRLSLSKNVFLELFRFPLFWKSSLSQLQLLQELFSLRHLTLINTAHESHFSSSFSLIDIVRITVLRQAQHPFLVVTGMYICNLLCAPSIKMHPLKVTLENINVLTNLNYKWKTPGLQLSVYEDIGYH